MFLCITLIKLVEKREIVFFFKQKTAYEIGVTGVQTCALPISAGAARAAPAGALRGAHGSRTASGRRREACGLTVDPAPARGARPRAGPVAVRPGRARARRGGGGLGRRDLPAGRAAAAVAGVRPQSAGDERLPGRIAAAQA